MKDHFRFAGEFIHHSLFRIESVLGVGVILLHALGVNTPLSGTATLVIVSAVFLEAGYAAYRQERDLRVARDSIVTMKAWTLTTYSVPDEAKRTRIDILIKWEIWVTHTLRTDSMELDLMAIEPRAWYAIWKPKYSKRLLFKVPPDLDAIVGPEKWRLSHYQYRHTITLESSPFEGQAHFRLYGAPVSELNDLRFMASELVLVTGSPVGEYRCGVPMTIFQSSGLALATGH